MLSRNAVKVGRICERLETFKEVILDFDGVEFIGQGFADELFRVYATAHPQLILHPVNVAPDVERIWKDEKRKRAMQNIAIYGAQMVAVSVYYAIKTLYPDCQVTAFIVSNSSGNPSFIDGIPVVPLNEFDKKDVQVLIAVPENHHLDIIKVLKEKGFENFVGIDSKAESALMEKYYKETGRFETLHSFPQGEKKADISVYITMFYKDQALRYAYKKENWMQPIQAGAALTDVRIADICDNTGENISEKNVNYSELTAMYWLSKHADNDYLGLFHYRRILDVKEEDLFRIRENDIDVILPYPTIHYPNISEHHKRYLKEQDWNAMLRALEESAPSYAKALPVVFEEKYFYNYNMFIAKKQVFKNYCNWLFPILKRTEELSVPKGAERADRYIGYLGESLTTLYFMVHQDDLKIAHTGRLMLI